MRASFSVADDANPPTTSTPQQPSNLLQTGPGHSKSRQSVRNIFQILAQREISPWTKRSSKRLLGDVAAIKLDFSSPKCEAVRDARSGLISWVEAESLMHLSAKYCSLLPPPRSTIAAAFSSDGKTLASTHGDHTVKIIDCYTGSCLKVLSGHRRTPWVVRFHPLYPFILASGSLDHEVRLWNANTAECIASRDFYRPIASIAFHAQGELLAVASGHKLYIWHYNRKRETTSPSIILKTRRSLRAVHFHPHAAPFLLTAEVNDIDSSDSTMTLATSPGYLQYPPPIVYFSGLHSADRSTWTAGASVMSVPFLLWPSDGRENVRTQVPHTDENSVQRAEPSPSVRLLTYSTPSGQYELLLTPIETNTPSSMNEETRNTPPSNEMETEVSVNATETLANMARHERVNRINPSGDSWELPFLQGWLMGQTSHRMTQSRDGISHETPSIEMRGSAPVTLPVVSSNVFQSRINRRSASRHPSLHAHIPASASNEGAGFINTMHDASDPQPVVSRVQPELATSLAAAAAAELPCTVKLRIWLHDVKNPCVPLDSERCRLTIPHVVLCSEMGAHFSPCGRFLAACVACMLPHLEADLGFQSQANHDLSGAATSPTRHPISAHQVIYELRIYSLEEATFGMVLASRAVRAAHCLTSIQFSPTSEHLLLAYGRRHHSLLKSIVVDGESTMPIYTILEVYRVSNMELVRVLPGAEDEVNVACFHPSVGGGLVYGTKEGKLRIFHYDRSQAMNRSTCGSLDENTIEDKNAVYTPTSMLIVAKLVGIYCNYIDLFRRLKGMQV